MHVEQLADQRARRRQPPTPPSQPAHKLRHLPPCFPLLLTRASPALPAAGRKALQEQWSEWWCEGSGCDDFPPAQQNGGQTGGQTGQPPQTNGQPIGQPNGQPTQDNGQGAPSAPTGQGAPCPDQQAVLDQHNQARAARAAQPLQWSALLAADAAAWSAQCNRDNFGYSVSAPAIG